MKKITRCFWFSIGILLSSEGALWAAGGGGGFSSDVIWQILAFIFIVIFLVRALKKPLGSFLVKRRNEIRSSLEQASSKEGEANRLLGDWEKKIIFMNQEISALHQSIRREGEEERQKIVERAHEENERIRKQAQVIAEQEVKKARASLKKEMVDLSVELAEKLLKKTIQPQDQERLIREYMGKMRELR